MQVFLIIISDDLDTISHRAADSCSKHESEIESHEGLVGEDADIFKLACLPNNCHEWEAANTTYQPHLGNPIYLEGHLLVCHSHTE